MRLDKFLKVSRLIRRRTLAKQVADQGRIQINGQVAKAGTRLVVGDEVKIQFGQTLLTVEIIDLKDHVRREEAEQLYRVIKEERTETK